MFSTTFKSMPQEEYRLSNMVKPFKSLSYSQMELMSQVCKAFKLLLVMPATNAVSERSFSALRGVISVAHNDPAKT